MAGRLTDERAELTCEMVIKDLRQTLLCSFYTRQKVPARMCLKLIERLRSDLWTNELWRFYQKALRLWQWLMLPENKELWKRNPKPEPGNRSSQEYKAWRRKVMRQDLSICQECGDKKNLRAHHKKSYAQYPELRLDVNNGIVLCQTCHKKVHYASRYN